ncbi:MAG: hypothetical protein M3481_09915 [Actinomycetota bacterium]|jgi:hypothetical protein|nr:hypothetical protein [Actinomycetota bacterium]
MHDEMQEPTEEELRAALEEQMRHIRVEDVILQTVATLVNLGARRLGLATAPGEDLSEERDIEQARLAIEAVRALVPLSPPEQIEPVRQALSQLQMAFARETQAAGGAQPPPGSAPPQPGAAEAAPGQAQGPGAAEDERAKARSKIWTPPGR